MSAAPPPNWYPDPHDQAQLRWWDGSKWTEHLHALVPETAVATDERRSVASSTQQEPAAPVEQSVAATIEQPVAETPRPVVDQWAMAKAPEQEVLQPFRAQDFESARLALTEDLARREPVARVPVPEAGTPVQPWRAEERGWSAPVPVPMPLHRPDAPPPPNRRPMILGAAVIVVLLVGVLAFVLTRDGDDEGDVVAQTPATSVSGAPNVSASSVASTVTTRPAGTTATATTSALGGSTFTDPTNAYRLRVAPAWQDATAAGGLQTWSTGTNSNVFRDSVNVLIEKLTGDISMDDYLAASVRNAPKSLPSFVEVSRSVNNVNGKVLGQLDFRSNQNIPLRHRAVVVIKGRNAIVVTYTTEPARFDAESVKVQPYLTSVEGV